jgi:hypothetical protein
MREGRKENGEILIFVVANFIVFSLEGKQLYSVGYVCTLHKSRSSF